MFHSLRARLWLSYALLIAVALAALALVLFSYLISNPLIYRQTAQRIYQVEQNLVNRQSEWADLPAAQIQRRLERAAETPTAQELGVRVLVFTRERKIAADSQPNAPALVLPRTPRLHLSGVQRDSANAPWLYSLIHLKNGSWLMVTAPRPNVPRVAVFRDEFFAPILRAGILALLLALLLAYVLARWVADPLQRLVAASKSMPAAYNTLLEVPSYPSPPAASPDALDSSGPREVQELVRAYQDMLLRVQAGQKAQRDFVANVSHEMKTPLTSIQGFAQALIDGTAATPAEQQQAAGIIYAEAGRMHRLVVDLLDLARLDAGTANLKSEPVNLAALLETVGEKFALQARQAGVTLEVQPGALPAVIGDGDRLAQVLTNLVDNALRYTPSGGTVTLSTRLEPESACVLVRDTGTGIAPEALPHIFERFYRADPARPGGKDHGAGLGLAIAQEIALGHHGTLTAESQPGQGSTFTLRLPLPRPSDRRKPRP
jgi:signal transduction histidine kinase